MEIPPPPTVTVDAPVAHGPGLFPEGMVTRGVAVTISVGDDQLAMLLVLPEEDGYRVQVEIGDGDVTEDIARLIPYPEANS